MIKVVVLPADPSLPVRLIDHDETSLTADQALVGGLIEGIDLVDPHARLYVRETGKIDNLPLNGRATLLAWVHAPQLRALDVIAGDAYLTGPSRRSRNTDTPAALLAALTGTAPVHVHVHVPPPSHLDHRHGKNRHELRRTVRLLHHRPARS
ncbi:DUF3846 domain-containing protein [Frankia sp. R82]|uniref:DUF3846 domain-containing protein n=1 Tax=Frankia sp. R82 TaxID=2950553 RepID=UPI0020442AB1|nr:DUF3846 domain-containing protein [Frankia sp. R82]MCM3885131.1 DUF3846 domain-containing protein [Frankia sp. R82]